MMRNVAVANLKATQIATGGEDVAAQGAEILRLKDQIAQLQKEQLVYRIRENTRSDDVDDDCNSALTMPDERCASCSFLRLLTALSSLFSSHPSHSFFSPFPPSSRMGNCLPCCRRRCRDDTVGYINRPCPCASCVSILSSLPFVADVRIHPCSLSVYAALIQPCS